MKKILTIAFLFAVNITFGQIPKPLKKTFVNDYTGTLTLSDIKTLNQQIYKIQKDAGVQLAVVLVNHVPANYSIKKFASQIGKTWHVGTNKRGMVYVAAIKQHKQQLVVAKNLDSIFTAQKSEAILAGMKSAYRNGDYAGGLAILAQQVRATLVPETATPEDKPVAQQAAVAGNKPAADGGSFNVIIGILIVGLPLYFIYRYFSRRSREKQMQAYYNNMNNPQGGNGHYPLPGNMNYPPGPAQYPGGNYNNGSGYGNNGGYPPNQRSGSGIGSFVAGAALGAAGGYAARAYQDRDRPNNNDHSDSSYTDPAPIANSGVTEDNNSNNWGNWGAGEPAANDSGFSDDSSSSSDDSGFSSDDSSSSDSGSSDSDSSSGDSSNW